jgi:hypothetical protein
MSDYSKGKIYKIKCDTTGLVYIGSTTQKLSQRIAHHVWTSKTGKGICSSRDVLENNNYRYSLIEKFPCETREQLNMREQHYIDQTECVNKHRAFRTGEQRLEQYHEYSKKRYQKTEFKEYKREYRLNHKEQFNKWNREWYARKRAQLLAAAAADSSAKSSSSTT